jgi:hypothetical protein
VAHHTALRHKPEQKQKLKEKEPATQPLSIHFALLTNKHFSTSASFVKDDLSIQVIEAMWSSGAASQAGKPG